jgi:thiol-disulfide isomerase/thioredoxin
VSLPAQKGKLVLLNFWITHCGYCIASVPEMNALQQRYKGKNVKIFAINPYDPETVIRKFQDRMKVQYEVLTNGEEVRLKYGVEGFPTVVLLDKDGTVLYAGAFEKEKIQAMIDKHL